MTVTLGMFMDTVDELVLPMVMDISTELGMVLMSVVFGVIGAEVGP